MNIFIAFANQDRDVRDKLLRQMNLVKDRLGWNIWSSKEIKAGERWDEEIKQRLMDSEVIVLLLSTDFFNSTYIVETELPKVVEKHRLGNCHIIPVIARVCHWKETHFGEYAGLGDIQALPVGERPIVSRGHWDNDDQPYFETVQGIRDSIQSFQAKKQAALDAAQAARAAQDQQAKAARDQAERERLALEKRKQEQAAQTQKERDAEIQRAEKERLAAEQRDREDRARRARETAQATAAEQAKAAQAAHDREEQARFRREQEQGYLYADQTAGQPTAPIPWGRYASVAAGVLALAYLLWWGLGRDPQVPESSKPSGSPKPSESALTQTPSRKSGLEMVQIEGGTFTMGSPSTEEGRYDNECQHPVSVAAFSIGKYEVTQADWRDIMGSDPPELKFKGCDDCPVESVSWDDVQVFLQKINAKYPGRSYRLPTEAEWEYAAKGGSKSRHYTYAGGNSLGSVAWYTDNSGDKTHPVGGKSPNELGLYDLSGNVWEWCQDTWGPYPCDKKTKVEVRGRVGRGGGYAYAAQDCRPAIRYYGEAAYRYWYVGFRLVSVSLQ